MKYNDFEKVMSSQRIQRYLLACNNNTRKTMTLYRLNLRLSQELFTIISCFEIALRNAIDRHYTVQLGNNWIRHASSTGGIFDTRNCRVTANLIRNTLRRLQQRRTPYNHYTLLSDMDFGFWRYLFASPQYRAGNQSLLQIFPSKPSSTPTTQYNQTYVFNKLGGINNLRNRIAHHEPICFTTGQPIINVSHVRQNYQQIKDFFVWLQIDHSLLYGIDHIDSIATKIDNL